ncbi:putative fibrous sheath CABYR-binding protein [Penaeus vannamei]|uniref:Putative fibrous sheath CABYR-binding protein n=1 Tax=Penaeus vannamei TaxID=6689 RepID=A0A3R7NNZ1_PENVA|nr:putative fibrous sheath CABYR-binding protein [Penaeus vannamei]
MKVFLIVALAAAAVGQQFQQQRQYDTAVRLATPGYFTQGGSFTSASFQNANGRLQGDSFQNSFQTATSDANTFRQSGLFQNSNQLQRNAATNRNQFQTGSFQQNSFDSNAFQQNTSPFQQNSNAQSANASSSQVPDNSFQTFDNQRNSASTFSTFNNQQNLGGQFQQRSSSGFQSGFNQQDSNNQFQSSFNNQNSNSSPASTKIPTTDSSPFNNQNSNQFQSTFNNQDSNRFSQNSQTSSFLQSSSDSVSGVFEPLNLPSGASALLGGITSAFSCLDRPYGYYADQDNSCRVFHVCNPTLFSNGAVETYQYSFMCGEGSVFDQKELPVWQSRPPSPARNPPTTSTPTSRPAPTSDSECPRPSQPDYIRTRHSTQVIVGRTPPHATDMKVSLTLAAAAVGQQFQQQRQYDTAVRLATPGILHTGWKLHLSFLPKRKWPTARRLLPELFPDCHFRRQHLPSVWTLPEQQPAPEECWHQPQPVPDWFLPAELLRLQRLPAEHKSIPAELKRSVCQRFFQSGSSQFGSDNRFQTNANQINSGSRFQSANQQDNSFQTFDNQRNSASTFSTFNNQQNLGEFNNRFQSTFNNQDSNRFSQNSQTSSFLQSSSDSVSGVFEPLNLPSGASALLGGITSAFSCLDRPYGYYADQDNSCRVFHVCNPTLFSNGAVETYQYSFMCGEGSVFDQKEPAWRSRPPSPARNPPTTSTPTSRPAPTSDSECPALHSRTI